MSVAWLVLDDCVTVYQLFIRVTELSVKHNTVTEMTTALMDHSKRGKGRCSYAAEYEMKSVPRECHGTIQ